MIKIAVVLITAFVVMITPIFIYHLFSYFAPHDLKFLSTVTVIVITIAETNSIMNPIICHQYVGECIWAKEGGGVSSGFFPHLGVGLNRGGRGTWGLVV